MTLTNKFRGQYIEVHPVGLFHLKFKKTGHHYTWNKAKTYVNNILFGKMWNNVQGDEIVINHSTKDVCNLKYLSCTLFSSESANKVVGIINDSKNVARLVLNGDCTERIDCSPIENPHVLKSMDDLKKIIKGPSKPIWITNSRP